MKLIRRLYYLLNRRRLAAELAEEIAFHQAMPGRAVMGNTTLAREDARGVWIWPWLESIVQDLVFAVRGFLRDALTYAAVLATLAAAGLAATFLPARKAIRIDPVRALRYE